uniref:Uncharacterized protein n=1 Tax=uncultured marine virus TaxID=186617 RepID=A0A0F7L8E0_9VIRU|nr:hypothetical protein [uncultured marine virus]
MNQSSFFVVLHSITMQSLQLNQFYELVQEIMILTTSQKCTQVQRYVGISLLITQVLQTRQQCISLVQQTMELYDSNEKLSSQNW